MTSQLQKTEMASGLSGPPNKHFATFSMEEIEAKQKELENKNSVANEEKAVNCSNSMFALSNYGCFVFLSCEIHGCTIVLSIVYFFCAHAQVSITLSPSKYLLLFLFLILLC